jgi:hypothetical protein
MGEDALELSQAEPRNEINEHTRPGNEIQISHGKRGQGRAYYFAISQVVGLYAAVLHAYDALCAGGQIGIVGY